MGIIIFIVNCFNTLSCSTVKCSCEEVLCFCLLFGSSGRGGWGGNAKYFHARTQASLRCWPGAQIRIFANVVAPSAPSLWPGCIATRPQPLPRPPPWQCPARKGPPRQGKVPPSPATPRRHSHFFHLFVQLLFGQVRGAESAQSPCTPWDTYKHPQPMVLAAL